MTAVQIVNSNCNSRVALFFPMALWCANRFTTDLIAGVTKLAMGMLFLELLTHHNDKYKLASLEPILVFDNLQCQVYFSGKGPARCIPGAKRLLDPEGISIPRHITGTGKDCGGKTLSERPSETQGNHGKKGGARSKKEPGRHPAPRVPVPSICWKPEEYTSRCVREKQPRISTQRLRPASFISSTIGIASWFQARG